MLLVAIHPVENVIPEGRRNVDEGHVQARKKEPEAPTQISCGQQKAGLADYRPGRPEGTPSKSFEVAFGTQP